MFKHLSKQFFEVILQIERKWTIAFVDKFYGKIESVFILTRSLILKPSERTQIPLNDIARILQKSPRFKDQVYSNTRVPTRVNTNQHGSTRVLHESTQFSTNQHESDTSPTRVNTSPTRINTSPTRVNTNQHDSTRVQNRSRP